MAIKDVTSMNSTLKNYGVGDWTKSVELGNKINFREQSFIPIDPEQSSIKSFGDFLQESIGKVNQLQQDANTAVEMLASGKSQNLHETLLAVEQADIAFKTMNQVRTKVIDAYKEIMKMQV